MLETMHADDGRVGLSANQIGKSLRIAVIGLPEEADIILINPEIVKRRGERLVTEGCLSVPGYMGERTRAETVIAKGLDINGKPVRIKAEGLLAQALEHEIDHLDGKLYIDQPGCLETLRKVRPEEKEI
jgi:peptide deformylase